MQLRTLLLILLLLLTSLFFIAKPVKAIDCNDPSAHCHWNTGNSIDGCVDNLGPACGHNVPNGGWAYISSGCDHDPNNTNFRSFTCDDSYACNTDNCVYVPPPPPSCKVKIADYQRRWSVDSCCNDYCSNAGSNAVFSCPGPCNEDRNTCQGGSGICGNGQWTVGQGCSFGGGSSNFYWDGISNVYIIGGNILPSPSHPVDGSMICQEDPSNPSGPCANPIDDPGFLKVDDMAVYTINPGTPQEFSFTMHYNVCGTNGGCPTLAPNAACGAVSSHWPMRINPGQTLNFYDQTSDQPDYRQVRSITMPTNGRGLIPRQNNTVSVSRADVCGVLFSSTQIYVATDASCNPPPTTTITVNTFKDDNGSCTLSGQSPVSASDTLFSNLGNPQGPLTSNPTATFQNVPQNNETYTVAASQNFTNFNNSCCKVNSGAITTNSGGSCTIGSLTGPTTVNIGFSNKPLPWLNAFDGDVYGGQGVSVKIPSTGWLINRDTTNFSNWIAGGVGLAGSSGGSGYPLITDQTGSASDNRTSVRPNNSAPGWQVQGSNAPNFSYMMHLPPSTKSALTIATDWSNLQANKSYTLTSPSLPNGPYTVYIGTSFGTFPGGVATVFVNGNLNINYNIISSDSNAQGIVIIANGDINISSNVTRIDAVLIAANHQSGQTPSGQISITGNNTPLLNVYGGLYSWSSFLLQSRSLGGTSDQTNPAISVYFRPIYLTNINPDLETNQYYWQELTPH